MCRHQGRGPRLLSQLEQPSLCLLSRQGWPQNGHPVFSGFPHEARGPSAPGPRLLAAGPSRCWNGITGVAGRARGIRVLPALSLASAGKLVTWPCVRDQSGDQRAPPGHVLLTHAAAPPPLALWACWALSGHKAVLKHPPGSPGSSRPRMSRCPGCPPPPPSPRPQEGPWAREAGPATVTARRPLCLSAERPCRPFPHGWRLVAHPERGQPGGHLLSAWPHEGLKERLGQTGWPHGCGPDTCSRVR
uniref:Uncharacterized protein n=1 Tax=Rousettus aegyptiacus TaxID=9407 RepID=A0A7J8JGZ5_ROUAE|nr:hypothetical protein HJG63_010394 [Rousettus aegyptiacus]